MSSESSEDPLTNDVVLEIGLDINHVRLVFGNSVMQIGSTFVLREGTSEVTTFDPPLHEGNVNRLWPLVGCTVQSVDWNDKVVITFNGHKAIEILPSPGRMRGDILGRHDMTYEEF